MYLVQLMWRSASESKPVHSCYSQLSQAWRMVEPIRIILTVSNWFRRRTSHELNSMNSFLAFSFFSTSCFFLSSSLCLYLSWARLMHEINKLLVEVHVMDLPIFRSHCIFHLSDAIQWLWSQECPVCSNCLLVDWQTPFNISFQKLVNRVHSLWS